MPFCARRSAAMGNADLLRSIVLSVLFPLLVMAFGLLSEAAEAAPSPNCGPFNVNVAHGGMIVIDASACDGPANFGIGGINVPATNGTAVTDPLGQTVTYTHAGGGNTATSDAFVFDDGLGNDVQVNVTIGAPSSITVSPSSLSMRAGESFSQTLTAAGGTAPYTWAHDSGILPPGISFMNGVFSGTPTARGAHTFTIRVTDNLGVTATQSYTTTVANPQLTLTPAGPINAVVGQPTSVTFTGGGGVAPYTLQYESGTLPLGMSFSGGTLSGTPTATGSSTFNVRVTDSSTGAGAWFEVKSVTVNVAAAPTVTLSPTTLPSPKVATAYSQTISASGGQPSYTFSITSGALAPGLSLSPAGALSGTPNAAGSYSFTVTATDALGFTGSRAYTFTVNAPTLDLPITVFADATRGTSYSASLNPATGGTAPYTYSIASGALPPGLALSSGGVLSGTPTASGSFVFTVRATDSTAGTGPFTTQRLFTLDVVEPVPVANPVSVTVTYGSGANPVTLNVNGGAPTSVAIGTSPQHGTVVASGVSLTYQPDAGFAGADSFTYTASNLSGTSAPALVSVTVSSPTLSLSAGGALAGSVGQTYSQTFSVAGGASPYALAVTGLPAGLAVSGTTATTLTISGTPSQAGSFSLVVSATDSSSGSGPFSTSQSFSLNIGSPTVSISPPSSTLNLTYATAFNQSFSASGGTEPYSYSVTGPLPAGMSFSSGTLSGTPTQPGAFPITVMAQDNSTGAGAPFVATNNYVLQVGSPTIALTPTTLPNASAGTSYSTTLTASGGVGPYNFALTAGTLPSGLSLSPSGELSGAPSQSGSFGVTISATDANGQSGARAYSLIVGNAALSLSPSTLPPGSGGTAYNQTFVATGGVAPYSFAISAGSLPPGISLAAAGQLSGVPSAAGTFSFDVTATDSTGGIASTVSASYNLVVAAPTIAVGPASLPAGVIGYAYDQALTASGGTAPYTYTLSSGALPPGLSVTSGGELSGSPASEGAFTFTVMATDALGFSGTATFNVVIGPDAPQAVGDVATTIGGHPVTIAVTGNDIGAISSVEIVQTPGHGTATVSGNVIDYTAETSFSGTDTFTYRVHGPGGTSSPAAVTINVNPRPIAVAQRVGVLNGKTVTVDLTAGASGGPFIGATLVSLSPPGSGTATLSGQVLTFTADPTLTGAATATFTLRNAYATSEPATIQFDVVERPDPTLDAEVIGILNAQTAATRRFATTQIMNFHQRLEALRGPVREEPAGGVGFVQGIVLSFADDCRGRGPSNRPGECRSGQPNSIQMPFDAALAGSGTASAGGRPNKVTIWTGGSINVGERDGADGFEFETTGVSGGVDYRFNRDLMVGFGIGYGHDNSDVGSNGSRSRGESYTAALYGSYQPDGNLFIDGLVGYQWLSFDSKRYVTSDGTFASGERDGQQWFVSISAGGLYDIDGFGLSPYARLDIARAQLDAFTENGDPSTALHYGAEDVHTTTGSVGVTLRYDQPTSFGVVSPELRLEYQHDFAGDSAITMNYADIFSGPTYRALIDGLDRDRFIVGVGANIQTTQDFALRIEYRGMLGSEGDTDHGVLLNVGKQF